MLRLMMVTVLALSVAPAVALARESLYCNGQPTTDFFRNRLYPNGQPVEDSFRRVYYPNGQLVEDSFRRVFYPNGQPVEDGFNRVYWPNGQVVRDSFGRVYYPSGQVAHDSWGCYWPTGVPMDPCRAWVNVLAEVPGFGTMETGLGPRTGLLPGYQGFGEARFVQPQGAYWIDLTVNLQAGTVGWVDAYCQGS